MNLDLCTSNVYQLKVRCASFLNMPELAVFFYVWMFEE